MLNLILRLIYKNIPSWLYYKIAFYIKERRLEKTNKFFFNKNYSQFIYNILKCKKKSEKIFIFGGGSSINDLTRKNFMEINKNCSIGINMWIFHKFVTDYYMIELTNDNNLNERFRLKILSLLNKKSKSPMFLIYKAPHVFAKPSQWIKLKNSKKVFFYEYLRPDIFKNNIEFEFKNTLNFLSKKNKKSNVLTLGITATIIRAISLSLLLGYAKVIILGIDLKNTNYFWKNEDKNFRGIKTNQKSYGYHLTAKKRFGGMQVQKSILILEKLARKKFSSCIMISTNKSLLSSKLEKYKWKK